MKAKGVKEANYDWFLEPGNSYTNNAIASWLFEKHQSDEGRQASSLRDDTGQPRTVWEVDYSDVAFLQESKKTDSRLRFQVFNRPKVSRGPIRKWRFGQKKRPATGLVTKAREI